MQLKVQNKVVAFLPAATKVIFLDNQVFSSLSLADKAVVLTSIEDRVPSFMDSFKEFYNTKKIIGDILKGVDRSGELEFHGLSLTDETKSALDIYRRDVLPLFEKLSSLKPSSNYPFLLKQDGEPLYFEDQYVRKTQGGNYRVALTSNDNNRLNFKEVFDRATKYWAALAVDPKKRRPTNVYRRTENEGSRDVEIFNDRVRIGCQSVTRWQIEELGARLNYSFPE
jgi:hypothetical protein